MNGCSAMEVLLAGSYSNAKNRPQVPLIRKRAKMSMPIL